MDDALLRRIGLLGVAAVLAGGLAAVAARGRRAPATPAARHRCGCGATYRVTGVDRHRVYWAEGTAGDGPVLGDACVRCGAPLPSGRDTAAA